MNNSVLARSLTFLSGATCLAFLLLNKPAQAQGLAQGMPLWGLAGAIGGGVFGAVCGTLPAHEFLTALVITSMALLALRRSGGGSRALHAKWHGLEAPADGSAVLCWLGAFSGRWW